MAIIIILGFNYKNNKYLEFALIAIFLIITCFSQDAYDYNVYSRWYETALVSEIQTGEGFLNLLMRWGNSIGIDYELFRIIATIVEIVLIKSTIDRYSKDSSLFWASFILFPGWWLTTLLRHSLALAILIFGVRYLLEDKKGNTLKYIVCVILASLMHSAFWFFLILLLTKVINWKKTVIVGMITYVVFLLSHSINLILLVSRFLPIRNSVYQYYLNSGHSLQGDIVSWFIQMLFLLFSGIGLNAILKREGYNSLSIWIGIDENKLSGEGKYAFRIFTLVCTSTFVVSLLSYTSTASRLNHFYFVLGIIVWCIYFNGTRPSFRKKSVYELLVFATPIVISYLYIRFTSTYLFDYIIKMIFETNKVINLL